MKNTLFLIIFSVSSVVYAIPSHADSVYRWVDENGKTHYSSKAPTKNAKPAKLPEINRGEVVIPKIALKSCSNHGGIDCTAGADTDGSVICRDGFKEAAPRYRFSCNSPKLEIADVSDVTEEGSFSVFVRNAKSVDASKPAVFFKPEMGKEIKLSGPANIEGYGLSEFVFSPNSKDEAPLKVTIADIRVVCANCP